MKRLIVISLVVAVVALFCVGILMQATADQMPFSGKEDVQFANKVWAVIGDRNEWKMTSKYYPGESPHGNFLRMYSNMVTIDDKPYHIIVKDNFGGADATSSSVNRSPDKYLAAVTIMLQREEGYDSDNNDWFWAKYMPNGDLDKNPKGMQLAGRIAKGMDVGCIACHASAEGNDYIFTND